MGEDGRDPALPELRAMRAGVIAAIPLHPPRLLTRAARPPADRRNGVHQRQQLANVVVVGPSDVRHRDAVRIRQNVMFSPAHGDRLGSVQFFSPAWRAQRRAIHYRALQIELAAPTQFGEQGQMYPVPHAGLLPSHNHVGRYCRSRSPF